MSDMPVDRKPNTGNGQRTRVSQTDVPRHSIQDALRVATAIEEHYGGHPASPLDVATSIESTPSSSWFRTITGAAVAYGLTTGGPNSSLIGLTPLAQRIVAPTAEGDVEAATLEASLKPRVVREFLERYDQKKLPPDAIAQNVLAQMGVGKAATERTLKLIKANAAFTGVLRDIKGSEYVNLRGAKRGAAVSGSSEDQLLDPLGEMQDVDPAEIGESLGESESLAGLTVNDQASSTAGANESDARPKAIFVGHGKNHEPLKKLETILNGFKIPYKVVVDEPNLGRPIPTKVKNVLKECGSAILLFTKDEQFFDEEGNEVWRPSENVVFELGAASYEYDDRVVILKEKGIKFPTNFASIGWIEFDQDNLESKGIEILQELIGLGLVRLTPAG